jgi:2-dehydropantoate 2-reductase
MKTVIMGPGAMGSLFGGLLARAGEELWLVGYLKEQTDTICSVGLTFEEKGQTQIIPMNATPDVTSVGKADLVIFFVKTYDTEKAVSDVLVLEKEDTIFLTLQNGLGNEEVICKQIDRKKVILGVTGHGATLLEPGHIRHAGWERRLSENWIIKCRVGPFELLRCSVMLESKQRSPRISTTTCGENFWSM